MAVLLPLGAGMVALAGPASATVTAVRGSAYGVYGSISLFGGAFNVQGPMPSVTLPPGGSATAVTTTVPTLNLTYGPAVFFRSGPVTISTKGTPGPAGVTSSTSFASTAGNSNTPCDDRTTEDGATNSNTTVTSATANFAAKDVGGYIEGGTIPGNATIVSVESPTSVTISAPATSTATGLHLAVTNNGSCIYNSQFTASTASTTCTAKDATATASTHFTNGVLATATDDNQHPTTTVAIPASPTPNLTISGYFKLGASDTESFTYIFNEQIRNPDGSVTVNAAHLIAQGQTAYGDTIFGQSFCGVTRTSKVTLTGSPNPSVSGQSVKFTAAVAPATGTGTPTGSVQFAVDGVNFGGPVTVVNKKAISAATTSLSVGSHNVTAVYSGDAAFTGSTGTLTQTVNKGATTTALTSSKNPAGLADQVTFTATVKRTAPSGGTPTGTVQFTTDGANLGSPVAINSTGKATTTVAGSVLGLGSHSVTAVYSGDANFTGSTSPVVSQTIQ